jgi:hypothetical protein
VLDLTISDSLNFRREVSETGSDLMVRDLSSCQGVDASLYFQNELAVEVEAGDFTSTWGLNTFTIPITEYCYS